MGRYFISPLRAKIERLKNIFRHNKVIIYRNPPLEFIPGQAHEGFIRQKVAWEAYCYGLTWIKEEPKREES